MGDGGPATDASWHAPGSLALDSRGTLYVADTHNDRVRAITEVTEPPAGFFLRHWLLVTLLALGGVTLSPAAAYVLRRRRELAAADSVPAVPSPAADRDAGTDPDESGAGPASDSAPTC